VPRPFSSHRNGSFSAVTSPVSDLAPPLLPNRPHSSSGASFHDSKSAGRVGDVGPDDTVPPPTYEDAIADDIAPVDGPRRRYQQEGDYYRPLPDDLGETS
jgi:hypothetical protein